MEKIACIYGIFFNKDDKVYIGSTNNFGSRKRSHLSGLRKNKHANSYLQNAFNKHGELNLSFLVIEQLINPTKENLVSTEQKWMDFYQSYNRGKGYNLLTKAHQTEGYSNNTVAKVEKQRIFMIGKKYAKGSKKFEEFLKWQSESKKGYKHSSETKVKISEAHKNKVVSEVTKEKLRDHNLGLRRTEISKIRQSKTTTRLSEDTVLELRKSYEEGEKTIKVLAEQIGYSYKTTQKILTRKAYTWVT